MSKIGICLLVILMAFNVQAQSATNCFTEGYLAGTIWRDANDDFGVLKYTKIYGSSDLETVGRFQVNSEGECYEKAILWSQSLEKKYNALHKHVPVAGGQTCGLAVRWTFLSDSILSYVLPNPQGWVNENSISDDHLRGINQNLKIEMSCSAI